jgi:hypothetical protein
MPTRVQTLTPTLAQTETFPTALEMLTPTVNLNPFQHGCLLTPSISGLIDESLVVRT